MLLFNVSSPMELDSETITRNMIDIRPDDTVLSNSLVEQIIIPVLEDESVVGPPYADDNYHVSQDYGGLFVGQLSGVSTRTWLKFNLSDVPTDREIGCARLFSYLETEYSTTADVPIGVFYSTDDSWSETTITWNNQPTMSPTSSYNVSSPDSPEMLVNKTWHNWDVTEDVKDALGDDKNISLVLRVFDELTGASNLKVFFEDEYSTGVNASYLLIEYDYPQWEDLTESADPVELGGDVTISVTATSQSGINQSLFNYGGENQTMTQAGDLFSYIWTPSGSGNLPYIIYIQANSGFWNSTLGSVLVEPSTPPDWVTSPTDADRVGSAV